MCTHLHLKSLVKITPILLTCASCGSMPDLSVRHQLMGHKKSGDAPKTAATEDLSSPDQLRLIASRGWGSESISVTQTTHPRAQCRLMTYLSGALCQVAADDPFLPKAEQEQIEDSFF